MAKTVTLHIDQHQLTGKAGAICVLAQDLAASLPDSVIDHKPEFEAEVRILMEQARKVLRLVSYENIPQ